MALLTLKDIGKIYVSEENVTIGIRGVNLSFERGEFVAVTGKSGSGKSTLLNVISGIDSYEEGELYIEGQPTSHYLQPEWEEYREKYISFIFQDYNIIESFTVLQNVELALTGIDDRAERRRRALELIDRVGLTSHINHKGSRLSGGQKQRTVIARALAKNSPIILADEPTGNLDSATSKEIIELLREVSHDKLLIVVTHNFDEVESHATRHIRIFDGSVEFDHRIIENEEKGENTPLPLANREEKRTAKQNIRNGFTLGRSIFTAKPKLSVFLSLLLILGTLGIFIITTFCGEISNIFEPHYMFKYIDGRVIITTSDARPLTEDEVKKLVSDTGAESYIRFDALIDRGEYSYSTIPVEDEYGMPLYLNMESTYGESFGDDVIGRYPEAANEVFLYLPIYYSDELGEESLVTDEIYCHGMQLKIVGVKYFYDNNLPSKCLYTEEGFRTATAMYYLTEQSNVNISISSEAKSGAEFGTDFYKIYVSFDMPEDKVYIDSKTYNRFLEGLGTEADYETEVKLKGTYYGGGKDYYGDFYYDHPIYDEEIYISPDISFGSSDFEKIFYTGDITTVNPGVKKYEDFANEVDGLVLSDELVRRIAEASLNNTYKQASLFFKSDSEAHNAVEKMRDAGYIAVPSDTTFEPDALSTISDTLFTLMLFFVWGISIVFLAFFINICSSRVLSAFKGDMAIMRSMGIPVTVIRIGMYARMLISLIPALILLPISAVIIFTSPSLNELFVYLYGWQYALIVIGVILLTVRVTHKQIGMLFGESVKQSLRGGSKK